MSKCTKLYIKGACCLKSEQDFKNSKSDNFEISPKLDINKFNFSGAKKEGDTRQGGPLSND